MTKNAPPKFRFEEFYEMLREYVSNADALEALALYDSEYAAGRGWVYDTGSEVATDANSDFIMIGWSILVKHGWPTYKEALELRRNGCWRDITTVGTSFAHIARRVIRDGPERSFPHLVVDINDQDSIIEFLRLRQQEFSDCKLYELPGEL
jgi:hypothetical protein